MSSHQRQPDDSWISSRLEAVRSMLVAIGADRPPTAAEPREGHPPRLLPLRATVRPAVVASPAAAWAGARPRDVATAKAAALSSADPDWA
jgi:hypothetical protein